MARRLSEKAKSGTEDKILGKQERTAPISWWSIIDVSNDTIDVCVKYIARNRVDSTARPKEHEMKYQFIKEEMIKLIPDEVLESPYMLVNYARKMDDKYWEIRKEINDLLCNDLLNLLDNTRIKDGVYKTLLNMFANNPEYQARLDVLIRIEVILKLLKNPKSFYGDDIRKAM